MNGPVVGWHGVYTGVNRVIGKLELYFLPYVTDLLSWLCVHDLIFCLSVFLIFLPSIIDLFLLFVTLYFLLGVADRGVSLWGEGEGKGRGRGRGGESCF